MRKMKTEIIPNGEFGNIKKGMEKTSETSQKR